MANIELVSFDDIGSDRPSIETTSNNNNNNNNNNKKNANIFIKQTKATTSVSKITINNTSIVWEALGTTELLNDITGNNV